MPEDNQVESRETEIEIGRWYRRLPGFLNDGAVMALYIRDGIVTYDMYGVMSFGPNEMSVDEFIRTVVKPDAALYSEPA